MLASTDPSPTAAIRTGLSWLPMIFISIFTNQIQIYYRWQYCQLKT